MFLIINLEHLAITKSSKNVSHSPRLLLSRNNDIELSIVIIGRTGSDDTTVIKGVLVRDSVGAPIIKGSRDYDYAYGDPCL